MRLLGWASFVYFLILLPIIQGIGCYRIIYAEQNGNDINIKYSAGGSTPTHVITSLSSHTLPTAACEPNFKQCSLQCFICDEGGDLECCALPVLNEYSDNSLALFVLQWSNNTSSSKTDLELHSHTVITHGEDCITAHLYTRALGHHFVDCINITAAAYIWFLNMFYEPHNISGSVELHGTDSYTQFEDFPDSLSLSEALYLQSSPGDCHSFHNIFFVANSLAYVVFENFMFDSGSIDDCWYPLDIDYIEIDQSLLLRVQCSQHITKLFTACGSLTTVETYDSRVNGSIYQCHKVGNFRANITLRDGFINFTTTGSVEDFGNIVPSHHFSYTQHIVYGFCSVGNGGVSFVFGLSNGSVFSLSFTTGQVSTLSRNSCDGSFTDSYNRGHCYKEHSMDDRPDIIVGYDHWDSSFKVADLSCPGDPIVEQFSIDPKPPLAGFLKNPRAVCGSCRIIESSTSTQLTSTTVESTMLASQSMTLDTSSASYMASHHASTVIVTASSVVVSRSTIESTDIVENSAFSITPTVQTEHTTQNTTQNTTRQEDEWKIIVIPIITASIVIAVIIVIIIVIIIICVKRYRKEYYNPNTQPLSTGGVGVQHNHYTTTSFSTNNPPQPPNTLNISSSNGNGSISLSNSVISKQKHVTRVSPVPPTLATSAHNPGELAVYERPTVNLGANHQPEASSAEREHCSDGGASANPSSSSQGHSHNPGELAVYNASSEGGEGGADGCSASVNPSSSLQRHSRNPGELAVYEGPTVANHQPEASSEEEGGAEGADGCGASVNPSGVLNNHDHPITATPTEATGNNDSTTEPVIGHLGPIPRPNRPQNQVPAAVPNPQPHQPSSTNPQTGQQGG